MASYQSTFNTSTTSGSNRSNRHNLIRKNPPAVLCLMCFTVFAGLAVAALVYLKWHRPEFSIWPAFTVLGLSLLWVVVKAMKPRKPKEPVQGLAGYAVIGVVVALLSVGVSAALQRSVLFASESIVKEPADNLEKPVDNAVKEDERNDTGNHQSEEETSKGENSISASNSRQQEVMPPPIEQRVVESPELETVGPEPTTQAIEPVAEQPEPSDPLESEPNNVEVQTIAPSIPDDLTIPIAEPIVLPAGTRLQWEHVDGNTFDIRLEERPGRFVTGLLKTDIKVETLSGDNVAFDVVEARGRGVAVRSSLVMVLDEALPIVKQQTDVPAALNTVLSNSTYAGYRLVTAGASIRTLVDWTSSAEVIRNAFPRFRQSFGNAFSTAVSLSLSELSSRSNRRILVVVTGDVKALTDDATFRRRLASDEVELVIISLQNPLKETDPLAKSVVGFDELPRLKQRMRSLTIRQEDPRYRIELIDSPSGSRLRLSIGSGDSAVTEIISAETVDESVTDSPSR